MPSHSDTLEGYLLRRMRRDFERHWPTLTDDDRLREIASRGPVAFAKEALGLTPWSRQAQLLQDATEFLQIALRSGHKTGKSTSFAVLALWFYVRYPGARVIITAPGYRQVQQIIWHEIKRLWRNALIPLPGECSDLAATGARNPATNAQILGYTSDKKEAIAGISGAYLMYLVDEASGVPQGIFQAIEGNRAGGNAWLLLASNPTRADGEFYDAFHSMSEAAIGPVNGYHTVHIDSRESPNVTGECVSLGYPDGVPGLATRAYVDRMLAKHGAESAEFGIRVVGSFAYAEQLKIFPQKLLADMQRRHETTLAEGPLWIGVDAGGIGNDPLGLAARRGRKCLEVREHYKIAGGNEGVPGLIAAIADAWGGLGKGDVVVVDADGETGARQYAAVRAWHLESRATWRLVRFRGSDKPVGPKVQQYAMNRDMLHAICRDWARDGGAIPPHAELERELHAPEFKPDLRQRLQATRKDGDDGLRALLGRSPDLADALMLSCYVPPGYGNGSGQAPPPPPAEPLVMDPRRVIDDTAAAGRDFDPYAGVM